MNEIVVPRGFNLDTHGGMMPTQVMGIVDGHHLYYRSRGDDWRVAIADTQDNAVGAYWNDFEGVVFFADGGDDFWGVVPEEIYAIICAKAIDFWRSGTGSAESMAHGLKISCDTFINRNQETP